MFQITENVWQGGIADFNFDENWAVVSLLTQPIQINPNTIHIHLPLEDGVYPGNKFINLAVDLITKLEQNNYKIYIHCQAGISRSATILAAYLMKKNNWKLEQTLNFIASKNPNIDPNPRFIIGLKEWI